MVRTLPFRSSTELEPGRILAMAAAIALHVLALLLLLMPMAAPQLATAVRAQKPTIRWIEREPKKEPEIVQITQQPQKVQTKPDTTPQVQRRVEPQPINPPVIVDGGSEPVVATTTTDVTGDIGPIAPTGPIAASHLEYVTATPPRYPVDALRLNATGVVTLRVLVDVDGTPIDVSIEKSSGNKSLDREARAHVLKKWRFKPAMQDGVAVQAYGLVPVEFSLR